MVIFFGGKVKPLDKRADFTRSFASWMELPASPTMLKEGRPLVKELSTSTTLASAPSRVAHFSFCTF